MSKITDTEQLSRAPKAIRVIGTIIKWLFVATVVGAMLWLTLLGILQNGTKSVKGYAWTASSAEAYLSSGSIDIWELTEFNDTKLDRLFHIGNLFYTEQGSQFQFMLRYNKFFLESEKIDFKDGDEFLFVLADNKGNRYTEYSMIYDEALVYGYYRVIFSGVDISEASELNVYIYLPDDTAEEGDHLEKCTVWYNDGYKEKYSLSSSERKCNVDEALVSRSVVFITNEEKES